MIKIVFLILLIHTPLAFSDTAPMVYRYWDLGVSEKRDEYQFELLRLVLEKTRPTQGDFQLIRVEQKITSLRASREVSRGELINIEATPNWTTDSVPSEIRRDKRIAIKIPLLRGMLGYRQLVIRKSDLQKFENIRHEADLQMLIAGQGRDWEDIFIYRNNGYKVNSEADFYNLLSMLVAGRFDYIPLSVIEIDNFIQQFEKYSSEVTVAPGILIYYPFPVLFQVSINHPGLAERVEQGLKLALQDGSMDRLFTTYFSTELEKLRANKSRLFVLENRRVPEEMRMAEPALLQ